MSVNDPIADALVMIKNAFRTKKNDVTIRGSKLKLEIIKILKQEGFISDYNVFTSKEKFVTIKVILKYADGVSAITNLQRVSKVSRRFYVGNKEIKKVKNGLGISIITTSNGIMTDYKARKLGIGGEILCNIW